MEEVGPWGVVLVAEKIARLSVCILEEGWGVWRARESVFYWQVIIPQMGAGSDPR